MSTININQCQKFSGRIIVTFENGEIVSQKPVAENEHLCTLPAFFELAKAAGYSVTRHLASK